MEINQELKNALDIERGRAIDAFAKLEAMLCGVLRVAANLDYSTASTIFYANISLQPRVEIVTAIVEQASGTLFNEYWTSVCQMIDSLNKQRNKIVHWHSYPVYDGRKNFENTSHILIHPVQKGELKSQLSAHDLKIFTRKTEYVADTLFKFMECFESSMDIFQKQAIEIFSNYKVAFPPKDNDPVVRLGK